MPLAPGETIGGYTVIRQLGSSGMGAVYLVRHPRLPRMDALKLLKPEFSIDPDFSRRFLREADVVAGLSHRNIVTVLDRGEDRGQLWLTMQYVEGIDAEQALADAGGILPADRVAHIVTEVAAALDAAHRHHLISEGVHPRVVMEVLGHAQMRTTTDTYSHVMPALGRDAADRMGNALWGPPAP